MSSTIGYARVSKHEQNAAAQETELRAAGDTLMVHRLDSLGNSERMIIKTLHDLGRRGVNIKSLTEPIIDTTAPQGRALFEIVAVFAQLRVDTM